MKAVAALWVCSGLVVAGCGGGGEAAPSASAAASSKPSAAPPSSSPRASAAPEPPPKPPVVAPPSDVPSAAPGANLTMTDATLDGVKLKKISCKVANANPFTAINMLGPAAKQKAALDACVDKPATVSVAFTIVDKKATDIKVAGAPTPEAAACIGKALEGAAWAEPMSCVVTLDLKDGAAPAGSAAPAASAAPSASAK